MLKLTRNPGQGIVFTDSNEKRVLVSLLRLEGADGIVLSIDGSPFLVYENGGPLAVDMPDGTKAMIHVFRVGSRQVKIGIDAPISVTVHRGEVQDRVDREGRAA